MRSLTELKKARLAERADKTDPKKRLAGNIAAALLVIPSMLVLYYFSRDIKYLVCGAITFPLLLALAVSSHRKERKDSKEFADEKKSIESEDKFRTARWKEDYTRYKTEFGFDTIKADSMKGELKRMFRTSETMMSAIMWLFLFVCSASTVIFGKEPLYRVCGGVGGIVFLCLGIHDISVFFGAKVRKLYKKNLDFKRLNRSFMKGRQVTYIETGLLHTEEYRGGLNFGTEFIVWWNKKDIYLIDIDMIENVSRRTERVKKFEDSVYTGSDYRHCAVFNVRLRSTGKLVKVPVRLNEFQVEMVIEEFRRRKYAERKAPAVTESTQVDIQI